MTPKEKDAVNEGTGNVSPDPSPPEQTPFERFEEFARRVVSVPKGELDERERAYREDRKRRKPCPG